MTKKRVEYLTGGEAGLMLNYLRRELGDAQPQRAMRFGPKGVTRYVDRRGDLYTYMVFDDRR